MNTAFWVAQGMLAAVFGLAGSMKVFALERAREQMTFVDDLPTAFTRFIGVAELLGAAGVVLPLITGVLPWLTPLAAAGFALVQLAAIFTIHLPREEYDRLPMNIVLLALAIFVAAGRWELLVG